MKVQKKKSNKQRKKALCWVQDTAGGARYLLNQKTMINNLFR